MDTSLDQYRIGETQRAQHRTTTPSTVQQVNILSAAVRRNSES